MTMIANAVYVDGRRTAEPASLDQTFETVRRTGGVAWIALYRPDHEEMQAVAAESSLAELAVENAVRARQRGKIERHGEVDFLVLPPTCGVTESGQRRQPHGGVPREEALLAPARTHSR